MEVMNRIDQKIEHLKYLYDKRIKHNQVVEEEIKRIKKRAREQPRFGGI